MGLDVCVMFTLSLWHVIVFSNVLVTLPLWDLVNFLYDDFFLYTNFPLSAQCSITNFSEALPP